MCQDGLEFLPNRRRAWGEGCPGGLESSSGGRFDASENDVRHPLEQGRVAVADGSSCRAAFRPEPDREHLHRPEGLERSGALDALPGLPVDAGPIAGPERARATRIPESCENLHHLADLERTPNNVQPPIPRADL
jgi:hypothetical protein